MLYSYPLYHNVQDVPFIFDFNTREWSRGPSIGNHKPDYCSASIIFGKHVETKVMVLMKKLSKCGYDAKLMTTKLSAKYCSFLLQK